MLFLNSFIIHYYVIPSLHAGQKKCGVHFDYSPCLMAHKVNVNQAIKHVMKIKNEQKESSTYSQATKGHEKPSHQPKHITKFTNYDQKNFFYLKPSKNYGFKSI